MKKKTAVLLAAALMLIAGGCNEIRTGNDMGRVVLKVTDAPFDIGNIESALVTITKMS
jgi:hypothetical protein